MADNSKSTLVAIVNYGKGKEILEFLHNRVGVYGSYYYGRGTMQNKLRRMIALDEVRKEIVFVSIPSERETEIINSLNKEFLLERENNGIAFVIPSNNKENYLDYRAVFIVVDSSKSNRVVEISQEAGYFGGTIIEINQDTEKLNNVLDRVVEAGKEIVMMILSRNNSYGLSVLLKENMKLDKEHGEMLLALEVSKTVGLYEDSIFAGLE